MCVIQKNSRLLYPPKLPWHSAYAAWFSLCSKHKFNLNWMPEKATKNIVRNWNGLHQKLYAVHTMWAYHVRQDLQSDAMNTQPICSDAKSPIVAYHRLPNHWKIVFANWIALLSKSYNQMHPQEEKTKKQLITSQIFQMITEWLDWRAWFQVIDRLAGIRRWALHLQPLLQPMHSVETHSHTPNAMQQLHNLFHSLQCQNDNNATAVNRSWARNRDTGLTTMCTLWTMTF